MDRKKQEISTPGVHCSVSLGPKKHLEIRHVFFSAAPPSNNTNNDLFA